MRMRGLPMVVRQSAALPLVAAAAAARVREGAMRVAAEASVRSEVNMG